MRSVRRLALPLFLALVNWAAQWATFGLVIASLHLPDALPASFAALVVTNLAGMWRLLPGNVGIFQAAMALALAPFGVAAESAVAAGLALQAIQVIPVLALGAGVVGWRGLLHHHIPAGDGMKG